MAGRPFFIFVSCVFFIVVFWRHFTQYALSSAIRASPEKSELYPQAYHTLPWVREAVGTMRGVTPSSLVRNTLRAHAWRMKVIVLGSTGAVGTQLTLELLRQPSVTAITLLVRRAHPDSAIATSPKVTMVQVDVFDRGAYRAHLPGHDVAFSTFGVGTSKGMSKEDFVKIDMECVRAFATECKAAGVKHFSSLGSVGANRKSKVFYLRIKGQLEQALIDLQFERVSLFRPSMILTPKNRYGVAQALTLRFYPWLNPLLVGGAKQFRGIKVEELGKAMARNACSAASSPVEFLAWPQFQILL